MRLPALLEDPAQAASLEDRIAAARALGADDPRLGSFAQIAAGSFTMGSDAPEGEAREHPARLVHTAAFSIALLPVTVGEFALFVARGYAERALWSDAGWEWRLRGAVERPRFWGEAAWSAYLGASQPVVGVSCFEAEAYAQFAGGRLPSEAEWERAARGEDARRFPWGDDWDPSRAAHRGGPRCTLPAGCFPAGRSPYGLWDVAGNVWEWCSDAWDARDGGPPTSLRSARGGAWNAHPPQLRCAHRNAWAPDARFSNLGFRLAR